MLIISFITRPQYYIQLKTITNITEILTWNKLQDILQCNRYIHLVKSDAEFDEHTRVPNRNSRIKNYT